MEVTQSKILVISSQLWAYNGWTVRRSNCWQQYSQKLISNPSILYANKYNIT